MSEFTFKNFGPIRDLVVSLSDDQKGGTIVLTGDNGSGKSTAIGTLGALPQDKIDMPYTPTDGCSVGTFTGPGVQLNIYPSTHRFSDKEWRKQIGVNIVNGVPLAKFIDPKIKDKGLRSDARNKALLGLVQMPLSLTAIKEMTQGDDGLRQLFLTDDQLRAVELGYIPLSECLTASMNLLSAADLVRTTANKKALQHEQMATSEGTRAARYRSIAIERENDAALIAPNGVIPELPSVQELERLHQDAIRQHDRVSQQAETRAKLEAHNKQAVQSLQEIGALEPLGSFDAEIELMDARWQALANTVAMMERDNKRIEFEREGATTAQASLQTEITQLEQKIALLNVELSGKRVALADKNNTITLLEQEAIKLRIPELPQAQAQLSELGDKRRALKAAASDLAARHKQREELQRAIGVDLSSYATAEDVEAKQKDVDRIKLNLEIARFMALAESNYQESAQTQEIAKNEQQRATWYRSLVGDTIPYVIGSELEKLGLPDLEMREGELYGRDSKRGMVPVDALSPGQLTRLAVAIAIQGIKRKHQGEAGNLPVIIPLDQEAWDSLTPNVRGAIHFWTEASGVWIITATARRHGELESTRVMAEDEREAYELLKREFGEDYSVNETIKAIKA